MRYNHLIEQDGFLVSAHSSVLHYDGFDTAPSDVVFKGAGGFSGVKKGKNTLAEFGPNTFSKNTVYDFSIWMHNGEQDALNLWFRCIIEEYDAQTDQWYSTTFFPDQSEVINGDWSLVEGTFEVRNPKNKIYLVTKGKKDAKAAFHADELLIKESGVDVYRSMDEEGMLFFNNHWVQ